MLPGKERDLIVCLTRIALAEEEKSKTLKSIDTTLKTIAKILDSKKKDNERS